tara:strand:- start:789 stop:995 length:207 start_codon:yes stop_codon:yes gene_type:complete
MLGFVITICMCFMVVKCTMDDWNRGKKPTEYKCVEGKTFYYEGKTLIESVRFRGQKCKEENGKEKETM